MTLPPLPRRVLLIPTAINVHDEYLSLFAAVTRDHWLYEVKQDGYRALAVKDGANGAVLPGTAAAPDIAAGLGSLAPLLRDLYGLASFASSLRVLRLSYSTDTRSTTFVAFLGLPFAGDSSFLLVNHFA